MTTATESIPCPTIHLGGTSGDELLRACCAARQALDDAQDTLSMAAPNRRDYHGRDDDWKAAFDVHKLRCAVLRDMARLYSDEAFAISQAIG